MNIAKKFKSIVNFVIMKLYSCEAYAKKIGVNIGENCYISTKDFPSEPYLITIGNNVRIAKNVKFFTHGGIWTLRIKYPDLDYFGKILIGDNTFIGEGCYILPGVIVGKNCIVGAGSIVTKSIPDGCVVAGNPAKIVGKYEDFVNKILTKNLKTKNLNWKEKRNFLLTVEDSLFIKKPFMKNQSN